MIDVQELSCILGADGSAVQARRVDRIHAAACVKVKTYARNAPTAVKNEALILYAAWIWQSGAQGRSVFPTDGEGPPVNVSRAFLLSGAQGLLSSWRTPRAGACR